MKAGTVSLNRVRSLLHEAMSPAPNSLLLMSVAENLRADPAVDQKVTFGRNRPAVDLCVGEDDVRISRHQGTFVHRDQTWWLGNVGRLPLRVADGMLLHPGSHPFPLPVGYTTVFLRGNRRREHVLEILVSDGDARLGRSRPDQTTVPPRRWRLSPEEHLVCTVIGQRYLSYDQHPLPLTRHQAAAELECHQPDETWTAKRVEHIVSRLRQRLSGSGVGGLRRDEVGEPVGLTLTINLIRELVQTTTLVPMDLERLEPL